MKCVLVLISFRKKILCSVSGVLYYKMVRPSVNIWNIFFFFNCIISSLFCLFVWKFFILSELFIWSHKISINPLNIFVINMDDTNKIFPVQLWLVSCSLEHKCFFFAYVEVVTYKKRYLGVVLLRSPLHRYIALLYSSSTNPKFDCLLIFRLSRTFVSHC